MPRAHANRLVHAVCLATLLATVGRSQAQITGADVYEDLSAGAYASSAGNPTVNDAVTVAGVTTPVAGSDSKNLPIELSAASGGGSSSVSGGTTWAVAPFQIDASGTFDLTAHGATQATGQAGADSVIAVDFGVETQVPYTVTGTVRTAKALNPSTERLQCQDSGIVLVDTATASASAGSFVPFERSSTIFPGERRQISCAVIKGVAGSEVFPNDDAKLEWTFTVALGTGGPATTTTTLPTSVKPKLCRRACRKAAAACRRACTGKGAERRLCKKACNQRRKSCGPATGCVLP